MAVMVSSDGGAWIKLPAQWEMDETIVGLPDGAKILFLRIVQHCNLSGNKGVLTDSQLEGFAEDKRRGWEALDRLKVSGALVPLPSKVPLIPGKINNNYRQIPDDLPLMTDDHGLTPDDHALTTRWVLANSQKWLLPSNTNGSIPAGQSKSRTQNSLPANSPTRARAEGMKEGRREEDRTPSGSVRSSSAPAAPRSAGGAAQPAQDQKNPLSSNGEKSGTLSRAEAIALARDEIRKGRAKNSAATGIDTKFSKYDPNRPITPINSVHLFGEVPE